MSKIKTFFKKPSQLWQRIFGFLPVISLGGTALILGTLSIAPNFMNFAHAEEKPALKPSDINLSISVDETFHKFNDVYLTSDGVEQEAQDHVTFEPTVKTNNPAGYKVYFSDVDEDTDMRSIDATVTDSIRSATPSDFENGQPKNTTDNYWYCGIYQASVHGFGGGGVVKTGSKNNDLSIPTRSHPKLIDEVKYVKPDEYVKNGIYCDIAVNKQLATSTYVGKMIFTTLANTNNLKPATLKSGYSAFRKIPNGGSFDSFKYDIPSKWDFSEEIINDSTITSNIKPDYKSSMSEPSPACPPTMRAFAFDMYNVTANNTEDEEPVLIWRSYCGEDGIRWWSPSGTLKLGENCSNFFSTANAPRFDNLDLSGIDISNCKNMESMFERTDEGFKEINFGYNKFSSELSNTKNMFKGNSKLERIRTTTDLDLTYVAESEGMFDGLNEISGSYRMENGECNGMPFISAHADARMAKTHGGYFFRDYPGKEMCDKVIHL